MVTGHCDIGDCSSHCCRSWGGNLAAPRTLIVRFIWSTRVSDSRFLLTFTRAPSNPTPSNPAPSYPAPSYPAPSPPAPSPPNIILNDTSLAVLSLSNGDRHLFFQDNTGLIRRAVWIASNKQWNTSSYLNATTNPNPKNFTPLAAVSYEIHDIGVQVLIKSWGIQSYCRN